MATQRPLKEGSVRTYQEKVALGFPDILASEVDADLDTIYAAWNGALPANAVDTTQLADGAVTTPKLAAAPNGVATGSLNDLAVTTAKLNNLAVTTAKLAAGASMNQVLLQTAPVYSNTGAETTFVTFTPTVRGGSTVVVVNNAALSLALNVGTQVRVAQNFKRDGTLVANPAYDFIMFGGAARLAFPATVFVDVAVAAGAHTYTLSFLTSPSGQSTLYTTTGFLGQVCLIEFA